MEAVCMINKIIIHLFNKEISVCFRQSLMKVDQIKNLKNN